VEPWSLTSLRERLIKIGAKVISHGRQVTFQMGGHPVAAHIQGHPNADWPALGAARDSVRGAGTHATNNDGGVRDNGGKATSFMRDEGKPVDFRCPGHPSWLGLFAMDAQNQTMALACPAIREQLLLSVNYLTLFDRFLSNATWG
jgi:hypothetical protein